ncbi:Tkl protein kinase [Globisporangium polare]
MGFEDATTIPTDLLLHEIRVWHRLNHPHVIKLHGASHVDKQYFVCEYAPNGDLIQYLSKIKTEAERRVAMWQKLYEAALGLEYVHSQNAVHNDLKCDNILVGADGTAKLIDFGLSCLVGEAEIRVDAKQMDAVQWRSPEYLRGESVSFASDVDAFAMCIVQAVKFRGERWMKVLSATT